MTSKILVNPDGTLQETKTEISVRKISKEEVERAIKDLTLELAAVQARLDYQMGLLKKFG